MVQIRHVGIAPIGGHQVLDQVVGADAEKVTVLGQHICHEHGRWCLDHGADLGQGQAGLLADVLRQRPHLLDLSDGGDHGDHDPQLSSAVRPCPHKGGELGAEGILVAQAIADGSIAQERVLLLLQVQVRDVLVSAYVQGANDDRFALEHITHPLVRLVLSLLIRCFGAVHVKEFGSEQANPFPVLLGHLHRLCGGADVAQHL